MDNEFLAPAKRQRCLKLNKSPSKLKIVERIRTFKLPQTYPSLAKAVKPMSEIPATIPSTCLKKLKLKLPDGRDLGEYDVQVLQDNKIKIQNKTLSLAANGQLRQKDSVITIKPDRKNHVTRKKLVSLPKNLISKINRSVPVPQTSAITYIKAPNSEQIFTTDTSANSSICMEQTDTMYVVQSGDNWQMIQLENSQDQLPVALDESLTENPHKQITNDHSLDTTDNQIHEELLNTPVESTTVNTVQVKKRQRKPKPSNEKSNKPKISTIQEKKKNLNEAKGIHDVRAENSENSKEPCLRNSFGKVNLIRKGRRDSPMAIKQLDTTNEPMEIETIASTANKSASEPPSKSAIALESDLSIVGEALGMVSDLEIRRKALQALADCGISIERLIPAKPPPDQMSIKESQTQTNVFGLLDRNMAFVRVTGDTDGVDRLQEIDRHIVVDDVDIPLRRVTRHAEFANQLNNMLDQHWVNKSSVEQVKELLKADPMVEKAYNLLEQDFKNVRRYDQKGLLSIHRAVLTDRENMVKRQIMILRSCKESVDIRTNDGRTALELAIEHFASPAIVNLLLKSGANPASNIPAHDSALTIASRDSSPYLPQLIKYVASSDDLNYSDSEGLCAVHYCALNGNHEGVKELIYANADLNVRDRKSGRTALFHAFENEYLSIVKDLLAHGAKGHLPTFAGYTVMTIFDEDKHYALKDALYKSLK